MIDLDVAIIGAGASGTLTALHVRRVSPRSRIALIEAGARTARGLAYGTPYGAHVLNVPARNMSAFPDDPGHFAGWLAAKVPGSGPETFAPRPLYGEYLAELVDGSPIARLQGTAVGLTAGKGAWTIHLHDGRALTSASVVLALGNLAPVDPVELSGVRDDRYVRDPWAPGVAAGLDKAADVLIVGSGLTMIDVVLALRAEGHGGRVLVLSRHGILPREHAAYLPRPLAARPDFSSPRAALRWIRGEVGSRPDEWRAVIDSLRPHTAAIWRGWSDRHRGSFLRHARYLWDAHRHRVAPDVASRVRALLDSGAMQVHSGRLVAAEARREGLVVRWRGRRETAEKSTTVARLINCTGPSSSFATTDIPLVAQMRRAGYLVPDALGLGVETADNGALLGRDGNPVPGLFTLGALRRPGLWETTAIPEIRVQAAELASLLRPT